MVIGKDEDDVGFDLTQSMPDAKHENTKRETENLHDIQDEDFERLINPFRPPSKSNSAKEIQNPSTGNFMHDISPNKLAEGVLSLRALGLKFE